MDTVRCHQTWLSGKSPNSMEVSRMSFQPARLNRLADARYPMKDPIISYDIPRHPKKYPQNIPRINLEMIIFPRKKKHIISLSHCRPPYFSRFSIPFYSLSLTAGSEPSLPLVELPSRRHGVVLGAHPWLGRVNWSRLRLPHSTYDFHGDWGMVYGIVLTPHYKVTN